MASRDAMLALEKELTGERAGSLARAVEALEEALRALAEAPGEEALAEARERLWFVVVQREAIGLPRHDVLYEALEVPGPVRQGMGPRQASPSP